MRGQALSIILAASLLPAADPAFARRSEVPACSRELGAKAAERLVRDCREAAPMTPALCRPDVPCEALRELIAEACRMPGAEARSACADASDDDGDEDADE